MATLTANKQRELDLSLAAEYADLNVVADDIIYEGAFCEVTAGVVSPISGTGTFCGLAVRKVDNTGGAAGDKKVRLLTRGLVRGMAVAGATSTTQPGELVYATDDDTLTLTAAGATKIGRLDRGTGTDLGDVYFESVARATP